MYLLFVELCVWISEWGVILCIRITPECHAMHPPPVHTYSTSSPMPTCIFHGSPQLSPVQASRPVAVMLVENHLQRTKC